MPPSQPARVVALPTLERDGESEEERGGSEKLDGEAKARIYICFSRFEREVGEAEEKWEKPRCQGYDTPGISRHRLVSRSNGTRYTS